MREWTNLVLDAIECGLLSNENVVRMCLAYMSEDDVANMCRANDLCEVLTNEEIEQAPLLVCAREATT